MCPPGLARVGCSGNIAPFLKQVELPSGLPLSKEPPGQGSSHIHPHFSPGASREGQALPLLSRGSFPAWVAGTSQG